MNRRQIQREKLKIEKELIPIGKRIISLEREYNELRAKIEPLPGDSEERAKLHKKAAEKLLELQNKNAEFTELMQKHNLLTGTSNNNRANIIENGKEVRGSQANPQNRDIQPT